MEIEEKDFFISRKKQHKSLNELYISAKNSDSHLTYEEQEHILSNKTPKNLNEENQKKLFDL